MGGVEERLRRLERRLGRNRDQGMHLLLARQVGEDAYRVSLSGREVMVTQEGLDALTQALGGTVIVVVTRLRSRNRDPEA